MLFDAQAMRDIEGRPLPYLFRVIREERRLKRLEDFHREEKHSLASRVRYSQQGV